MPGELGENESTAPYIHTNPEDRTGDSKDNLEPVKPRFKFAFAPHTTKEQAEKTLLALEDCDVIAIEQMGATKEDRIRSQQMFQRLADEKPGSPVTKKILAAFFEEEGKPGVIKKGSENDYYLFQGLIGTGKKILLIDISAEDQEFELYEKYKNANSEYNQAVNQLQPLPAILPKLRDWIDIQAEFSTAREPVMMEQLKKASETFEWDKDTTVGVVLGTFHTFVSHQMHKEGYPIGRTFIEEEGTQVKGLEKRIYGWMDAVARQKRFFPDKPLSDNLLKRIVLADLLIKFSGRPKQELRAFEVALEKMSEQEVDAELLEYIPIRPSAIKEKAGRARKFLTSRRERPPKD